MNNGIPRAGFISECDLSLWVYARLPFGLFFAITSQIPTFVLFFLVTGVLTKKDQKTKKPQNIYLISILICLRSDLLCGNYRQKRNNHIDTDGDLFIYFVIYYYYYSFVHAGKQFSFRSIKLQSD